MDEEKQKSRWRDNSYLKGFEPSLIDLFGKKNQEPASQPSSLFGGDAKSPFTAELIQWAQNKGVQLLAPRKPKNFRFRDGTTIDSLAGMRDKINGCTSYQEFYQYVNGERNEIADWVARELNEHQLAEELYKVTSIVETVGLINDRLDNKLKRTADKPYTLSDGTSLNTLTRLRDVLNFNMSYQEFYRHVNSEKNTLADWVERDLHDPVLANELRKVTSIVETVELIEDRLNDRLPPPQSTSATTTNSTPPATGTFTTSPTKIMGSHTKYTAGATYTVGPRRTAEHGFLFDPGQRLGDYTVTRQLARGKSSEIYVVKNDQNASFALKVAVPAKHFSKEDIGSLGYNRLKDSTPAQRCAREMQVLTELKHTMIIKPNGLLNNLPHDAAGLLLEEIHNPKTLKEVIADLSGQPWTFEECKKQSDIVSLLKKYDPAGDPGRISGAYQACLNSNQQFLPQRVAQLELELGRLREFYQTLPVKIEKAVKYIRSMGFLHRDLKPENILIESNENVKILDFGLSGKDLDWNWGAKSVTPPELYPYVKDDMAYVGIAHKNSDLWAVGLIAYEMAFGHHPFAPDGDMSRIDDRVSKYSRAAYTTDKSGILMPFPITTVKGIYESYIASYMQGAPAKLPDPKEASHLARAGNALLWNQNVAPKEQARKSEYAKLLFYLAVRPGERTRCEEQNTLPINDCWFFDANIEVPASTVYQVG